MRDLKAELRQAFDAFYEANEKAIEALQACDNDAYVRYSENEMVALARIKSISALLP